MFLSCPLESKTLAMVQPPTEYPSAIKMHWVKWVSVTLRKHWCVLLQFTYNILWALGLSGLGISWHQLQRLQALLNIVASISLIPEPYLPTVPLLEEQFLFSKQKENDFIMCSCFCSNLCIVMYRKFRNVPLFKFFSLICSSFWNLKVGKYAEPTLLTGSRGLDAYPWRSNFLVWWKFNFHFLAVWWISGDN